ncbi:acyl-CoA dehydrogenase family protein [Amycolatopsis suaedae]|uniref:Acyl-CoA dehydrogenase n=1 Tax=Amycolatopsis suaedae TaxID=2510978 RepID=A0A4Q7J7I1_9PSEU|nr:acyl-CoA dehydrogenase family protein [Amycolatopsis suaedae]RZQ63137.1 acyl-CoA dehydrogenase [Amycolatopsis suaedae]
MSELDDLRDTVRAVLAKHDQPWGPLCEQVGVAGLGVPEEYGGAGAGLAAWQVVAEETGRVLSPVPFLGSAVLAVTAASACGAGEVLSQLAEGTVGCLAQGGLRASGSTVDGTATLVLDGDTAEIVLAAARDEHGVGLYEVDPGVQRQHTPALDETRGLATIEFAAAPARRLGDFAADTVRDTACAVLAAEQAGSAARALEITVEYTKQRTQFGRPIGSFQALAHRMADLYVLVETARSMAYAATEPALAAAAKAYCSEAFATVAAEMIQLHGGIAITWDHVAHRYLKRAYVGLELFGPPREHLRRLLG